MYRYALCFMTTERCFRSRWLDERRDEYDEHSGQLCTNAVVP